MSKLEELARRAGKIAGKASFYTKKAAAKARTHAGSAKTKYIRARALYEEGKALQKYTKGLSKAQIKSQLNKAKRLKAHRPLTKREKIIGAALRLSLLTRASRKRTKGKHRKAKKMHRRRR